MFKPSSLRSRDTHLARGLLHGTRPAHFSGLFTARGVTALATKTSPKVPVKPKGKNLEEAELGKLPIHRVMFESRWLAPPALPSCLLQRHWNWRRTVQIALYTCSILIAHALMSVGFQAEWVLWHIHTQRSWQMSQLLLNALECMSGYLHSTSPGLKQS
jgi:hypothetical protein